MMRHSNPKSTLRISGQRGVALITGLIFLAVLSMLVLAALRSTLFEELMARGTGARLNAFEAAEAVARQVETDIFAPTGKGTAAPPVDNEFSSTGFTTTCNNGLCRQNLAELSGGTPVWKSIDWTSTAKTKASTLSIPGMSSLRYIVECLGSCTSEYVVGSGCKPVSFRVTARASPSLGGKAMVQTVFEYEPAHCSQVL